MKKALTFILMLTALSFAAEEKVTIQIEGMTCGGCVKKVTSTLEGIQGVKSAEVMLKPGSAAVIFESDQADTEVMMSAIAGLGYKASMAALTVGEATHCDTNAKEEVKAGTEAIQAKKASSKEGCAMASTCSKAGSKPKCGTTSVSVRAADAELTAAKTEKLEAGHACPSLDKCKELIEFHETMHPLHVALSDGQYDIIRDGYAGLAEKAEAVKAMKCDESCVTDVKEFEKARKVLYQSVSKLGKACKKDNNEQLVKAFDKMHEAYVELGKLAK